MPGLSILPSTLRTRGPSPAVPSARSALPHSPLRDWLRCLHQSPPQGGFLSLQMPDPPLTVGSSYLAEVSSLAPDRTHPDLPCALLSPHWWAGSVGSGTLATAVPQARCLMHSGAQRGCVGGWRPLVVNSEHPTQSWEPRRCCMHPLPFTSPSCLACPLLTSLANPRTEGKEGPDWGRKDHHDSLPKGA